MGSGARVKQLLEEVLSLPSTDRAAFLSAACGDDPELRHEVESLAAAADAASGFLQAPVELSSDTALIASGHDATLLRRARLADRFEAGAMINGRYRVENLAGEGGMGSVYRVIDTVRSRTLALKVVSGRTRLVDLFKIEFRTLTSLRHPHLAQSHDFEPIVGTPDSCFTMDYIEGRTIFDATEGAPWSVMVEFTVQLCRVLAYVHSRGIVHRDIKPNNVLVTAAGEVKLVDFGLVGSAADGGQAMGTPSYLAPELYDGRPGDHRCDFYSLGILVFQLLCRRLPFDAAHLTFPKALSLPHWLQDVVVRLCATDPADRFRSGNEIIEAINRGGHLSYPIETTATRESYVVSGRFVGREHEVQELSEQIERRLCGHGRGLPPLSLIGGQSGVGKTRLITELRHRLQTNQHRFIQGHCFEGATSEYGAFAEAITQLMSLIEASGGGSMIDRYACELAMIVPDIGRGRTVQPSSPLISPEAEKRRLLDTVAAFFLDATDLTPYVLTFDDLQWAPHGTVELLRYVLRRIALREEEGRQAPLAILGSLRDDEIAGRPIERLVEPPPPGTVMIRLPPLAPDSMQRLLCSMFSLEDLPDGFVTRVLAEAGGSPFFLEEVVRVLVENGAVFVEDGAWRTTMAVHELEIPATIVAAVRRRLETVTAPGQRHVLHLMAVHQKPMSVPLLAAISGRAMEEIQEALRQLVLRNIVVHQPGAAPVYRTAHDQVRTTVYADLGEQAAPLHGEIACALERISTGQDRPLSELAHHYWHAHDEDAALRYALLAGRFAQSVYANEEAIEHLEHALALMPADAASRAETCEQLASAHFLAGHYRRARQLLAELADSMTSDSTSKVRIQRKLCDAAGYEGGSPGEAVEMLWTVAQRLGARRPTSRIGYIAATANAVAWHFLRQLWPPHRQSARARPDHDRLAELSLVYLRLANFSVFVDPLTMFLPSFRAANVADRLGKGSEHCRAYAMVALALGALGLSRRSIRVAEEAVAEAGRLGSPWHQAGVDTIYAMVLLQTGSWPQALERVSRARDAFAAYGDHLELSISAYHVIETIHVLGDLAAARTRGRADLEIFERLDLQDIGLAVYIVVGRVLAKTGDDRGIARMREALAWAEGVDNRLTVALAHVALGDGYSHLGCIREAIEHLERAIAFRDENGFDMYALADASSLLAQAYAAQWRANGGSLTNVALKSFERSVTQAHAAGRRFGPMKSLAALAQGHRHRVRGRPQRAIASFDEASRLANALGARLWEAEAHFESGLARIEEEGSHSTAGRASLEQALSLFRACGARPAEQRAVAALRRGDPAYDSGGA